MTLPFSPDDLDRFVTLGWLRPDDPVPRAVAGRCRAAAWRRIDLSPRNPAGRTRPVVRIPYMASPPFVAAGNTPRLRAAFDQLAGRRGWRPLEALGSIPVRFPSSEDPGDTGWHVDMSLDWHLEDFWSWRITFPQMAGPSSRSCS